MRPSQSQSRTPCLDTYVAAVDLGASSGRVLLARHDAAGQTLAVEEIHRFENGFVRRDEHDCWDVDNLVAQISMGLERIVARDIRLSSVGIDTWGVDYVLLDEAGELLGQAVAYRDHRTDGLIDEVAKSVPRDELYARTGIAFMQFNTIYQLVALKRENRIGWRKPKPAADADYPALPAVRRAVLRTLHQCQHQPVAVAQDQGLGLQVDRAARPAGSLVPSCASQGSVIGEWVSSSGARVKVIAPATHDTASAVIAAHRWRTRTRFISSEPGR